MPNVAALPKAIGQLEDSWRLRDDFLQVAVLRRLRLGGDDGRGEVAAQQTPVPGVPHTRSQQCVRRVAHFHNA